MAWQFRRSVRIFPGLRLNLSKGGLGLSAGVRGARIGMGSRGAYTAVGIPGTGIYSINPIRKKKSTNAAAALHADSGGLPNPYEKAIAEKKLAVGCVVLVLILGLLTIAAVPVIGVPLLAAGAILLLTTLGAAKNRALKAAAAACAAYEAKDYERAAALLEPLLPQRPQDFPLRVMLCIAYSEIGRHEESLDLARALHAANPQEVTGLMVALNLVRLGRYEGAIPLLQDIGAESENYVVSLALLGEAYRCLGETGIAIAVLEQAPLRKTTIDGPLAAVHQQLGLCYEAEGDRDRALRHLRKAYAADASDAETAEAIARLSGTKAAKKKKVRKAAGPIPFECPHCNAAMRIPAKYAGQRGKCRACGKAITAPEA